MNALDVYVNYFQTKSKENDIFGQLSGHVIIGQLTKHIMIPQENYADDNRAQLLLIQRSGTGKTAGSDVFLDVCGALALIIHPLDDFSDAGAAGTILENDDNDEVERRAGFLSNSDIVHSDEASTLFDPTKHQAKMLIFLQKAMNPIGSAGNIINRSLSPGSIQSTSEASFLFTTYPPEEEKMVKKVLNSGLMQRMLFFPRPLDTPTKKKMSMEVAKQLFKKGSDLRDREGQTLEEGEITLDVVVQEFMDLKERYTDVYEIKLPNKFEPFMLQKTIWIYDYISMNLKRDDIKEKVEDFVNRWIVMIRKIATHKAILDGKMTIRKSDLVYAFNVIRKLIIATCRYIEDEMTKESTFNRGKAVTNHEIFYEAYKKIKDERYEGVPAGYVSKTDLSKYACLLSNLGTSWFNKERKTLSDQGYVKIANVRTREKYYLVLPRDATIKQEGSYASGEQIKEAPKRETATEKAKRRRRHKRKVQA